MRNRTHPIPSECFARLFSIILCMSCHLMYVMYVIMAAYINFNCPLNQGLLSNLHSEAETIRSLVGAVSSPSRDGPDGSSMRSAWSAEKQALLQAIQSLKDLVAQTRQASLVRKQVHKRANHYCGVSFFLNMLC